MNEKTDSSRTVLTGQITIISKSELRAFGGDSRTITTISRDQPTVCSLIVIICPVVILFRWLIFCSLTKQGPFQQGRAIGHRRLHGFWPEKRDIMLGCPRKLVNG